MSPVGVLGGCVMIVGGEGCEPGSLVSGEDPEFSVFVQFLSKIQTGYGPRACVEAGILDLNPEALSYRRCNMEMCVSFRPMC